ncbi:hypothetical protein [Claveliimonas bilis]|uniref:hypothetical protein n=1 Tax=Claveliimonas bilis TaxID=3028070 RepID=UPI00292F3AA7|nr:hypothetical protein [Claveliimonas bilis]BDZ80828.1 hypothetical protein Lac3_20370 [Claveliimonas bilis]
MIEKEKISKVPEWSKNDINRWADYIELMCLYHEDHLISKDDILDLFIEDDMDGLMRGEANHSAQYDHWDSIVDNYYEIIEYRFSSHKDFYPFEVEDGQCIFLRDRLSEKHMHYIFLLLCSSICFMDRCSLQKITNAFEKYCKPIMKYLMPVDAKTELFGTSRDNDLFSGNLRTRIDQLANALGAQTTKMLDSSTMYTRIMGGDAGLDIVSFFKLDDASHIPFALGQCTCSYDKWKGKQLSISRDTWIARIAPLAPFFCYMYVPFFCHDAAGRLEDSSEIYTCLIDRQRILNLFELHNELLAETAFLNIKNLIEEIW